MKRTSFILVVALIVLWAAVSVNFAFAETLTVDNDDSSNFDTIQNAIDSASNGDVVRVFSGVYRDGVTIDKQIKLVSAEGDKPLIDGSKGDSERLVSMRIRSSNVTVDGFEIKGGGSIHNGISIEAEEGAREGVTISNNEIHGITESYERPWAFGILAAWGGPEGGIVIEDNEIYDIGDADNTTGFGVVLVNASDPDGEEVGGAAIIRNNFCHDIYDGDSSGPRGFLGSAINVGTIEDTTDAEYVLIENNRYANVSNGVGIWATNSQVNEDRDNFSNVSYFATNLYDMSEINEEDLYPFVITDRTPIFGDTADVYVPDFVTALNFSDPGAEIKFSPGQFQEIEIDKKTTIKSLEGADSTEIQGTTTIKKEGVSLGEERGSGLMLNDIKSERGNSSANWNFVKGNLTHEGSKTLDALFNYWNSSDPDWSTRLSGTGPVMVSPWLGNPPWSSRLEFVVDKAGMEPPEGYLNTAVSTASGLRGTQRVIVKEGNYALSANIAGELDLLNKSGSPENTVLDEEIAIDGSKVHIGKWLDENSRGFTIKDDITVNEGVDGSAVHINWNNLQGKVVHRGENTLDAQYNWWGDPNPEDDTVGDVDASPCLPGPVKELKDYMVERNIDDPKSALASMTMKDQGSTQQATATAVSGGVQPDAAEQLVDEYGPIAVQEAMEDSDNQEEMVQELERWEE